MLFVTNVSCIYVITVIYHFDDVRKLFITNVSCIHVIIVFCHFGDGEELFVTQLSFTCVITAILVMFKSYSLLMCHAFM